MATFVAPIAGLIGSMYEATMLAFLAFLYAAFVSFTSMAVSAFFGQRDLLALGHTIVLVVFCGGGLGFVGWLKQRLGNPLVNVACSLTSLAIITVLTKEEAVHNATFSDDKIRQVLVMVIMGIAATTAVNLIVKPVSARRELREDMVKTTDSLGDMLIIITRSFLSGSEEELKRPEYIAASERYKSVFTSLTKNLSEARYEHYVLGTEKEYVIDAQLVERMHRLSQDIGGLRSAAATQFSLINTPLVDGGATPTAISSKPIDLDTSFKPSSFGSVVDTQLPSIDEVSEEFNDTGDTATSGPSSTCNDATAASPADVFSMFIMHLGPSMKSLAYTLKQILDELPFGPGPEYRIAVNDHFRTSLEDAINLFSEARKESLDRLYKSIELNTTQSVEAVADFEEVGASCGYFSFSLLDFAQDTLAYLDILENLKIELDEGPRSRSWKWLVFWRERAPNNSASDDLEQLGLLEQDEALGLSQEISSPVRKPHFKTDQGRVGEDRPYTYRLWKALRIFRRDDTKFAIKVGVGAALYALISFIPATRPFYAHWRGEWGLLSYMLVCSMTIGASNTTGYQRFLGTCIGAVCAIAAWIISDANPYLLAFFGWLVSLGCFYIILGQDKGPMGRFILLTYNLSALYAYSLSVKDDEDDDDEGGINPQIWEIVLHRVVAVMTGCIWGVIVTRLIWPISARQKLKDGICVLWFRMGLIWKRDPLAVFLPNEPHQNSYMDIREEFELHRVFSQLEALRKSAASEFELKGPFPNKVYGRILQTTGRMLDAFHAMNVVIAKDLKATAGEAEVLLYTRPERAELSARISHLFSVLASSMKLEYPLNDALPNIEHTRDRLLAKIFDFRKNGERRHLATDKDLELLYAYALVTRQLAQDIADVGVEIENLYGILDEESLKLQ
ncbi:hypothetical protein B0A49_10928 [Cryomyces minteri]|uniref:Integral membrane bound transporter domain-containing protein n=1 Tax=Cryomyces minteri TaxID=331657 RepID=A0A4U0WQ85_9PEZI|nr:hypothetical protein B0A49_10928 [Cryomyces minteri]